MIVVSTPKWPILHWLLLLPSSFLVGCCAALLWITQGAYLTEMAKHASMDADIPFATILAEYNSFFWAAYQSNQVFGNFLTALVLDLTR